MEIKRLRQFRTIVEAGGLVKAAGLLHLTAGALSKSMQDLEAEFGKTLFSRVGRALSPTVDGHRLYRESHRLIEEHQRLLKSFDTTAPSQPATLRIASFEVFTTRVLAQMVEHTLTAYALHVIELSVQDIGPAVLRGESDYGITYAPFPHKGLDFKAVGTSRFGVFARTGVFKRTPFAEIPFAIPVAATPGSTANLLGIDGWPYGRFPRVAHYKLTSLESALALARMGRCAVFLPEFVAAAQNSFAKANCRLSRVSSPRGMPEVAQTVYICQRANTEPSTAGEELSRSLKHAISQR